MYFGGASSYAFSDADKVVIFPDVPVASDFFEIIVDNASSVVTMDGFTIQAPGVPKVGLTHTAGTWNLNNSTIDGAREITGGAGLTIDATKITNSGAITQGGATVQGGSIINSTATEAFVMDDYSLVSDVLFEGNTTAIDATSAIIADAVELDNIQFAGNTTDITVNSANDITIQNLNGSNAATCTNTGAGNCTIETSVTITLNDLIPGSTVYIRNTTDSAEIARLIEPTATFTTTVNYTADKALLIRVRNHSGSPYYQDFTATGTLTSSGFNLNVNQISDE